ncbi:hypothetical protein [Thermoactinomyces sp. CICC 10522]|uniref:hypothetical protein n=1 Tax=Thermoactinomyces sp. CICC 10522 TaxID=2767427 RepID=UPI0018DC79F7|nr:hypothetical protein [Thermoactinomyces sp. CICC 10522]MBH8603684.1 hypothetical protein [Thermoactinomyces sp. CICC 10522]
MNLLPKWLQEWIHDVRWHKTGFRLLDETTLDMEIERFINRETDTIAFARADGFVAGGNITIAYKPLDEHWIYASFDLYRPVAIPIEARLEQLLLFSEFYVKPGLLLKQSHVYQDVMTRVFAMRHKRKMTELREERAKVFSLFVGSGHYDETMVSLENSSVFNPFLDPELITMASASGGEISQFYTKYSASIFSFYRVPAGENKGKFYVVINYLPCPYTENKQSYLDDLYIESNPACICPTDVPVDCLAALAHFQFGRLMRLEDLKKEALRGDYPLFIDFLHYLSCPFARKDYPDLEEVFLDFAGCGHPMIEQEVLELARVNGWRKLLKASGKS